MAIINHNFKHYCMRHFESRCFCAADRLRAITCLLYITRRHLRAAKWGWCLPIYHIREFYLDRRPLFSFVPPEDLVALVAWGDLGIILVAHTRTFFMPRRLYNTSKPRKKQKPSVEGGGTYIDSCLGGNSGIRKQTWPIYYYTNSCTCVTKASAYCAIFFGRWHPLQSTLMTWEVYKLAYPLCDLLHDALHSILPALAPESDAFSFEAPLVLARKRFRSFLSAEEPEEVVGETSVRRLRCLFVHIFSVCWHLSLAPFMVRAKPCAQNHRLTVKIYNILSFCICKLRGFGVSIRNYYSLESRLLLIYFAVYKDRAAPKAIPLQPNFRPRV